MKLTHFVLSFLVLLLLSACGGKKNESDSFDINAKSAVQKEEDKASTRIDLENKGVGPITEVNLAAAIDEELALAGKAYFEESCTICHKPDAVFIGPPPKGILKRRSPEWIMNMILNPNRMLRDDPLAKDLFMEFNGTPMNDQGMTEEQARAILEYFRTI
jgi:cytochrome c